MVNATLALEDGTVLQGDAFGASADSVFELVFNTSMAGYQEIITDPSYLGQGVVFTVPHIGNIGINQEDLESSGPKVSAVVIRSLSPRVSNWRATDTLSNWLAQGGVPGISGVDTRFLTRKLREEGTLKAALSTKGTSPEKLVEQTRAWPGLDGRDMVKEASCLQDFVWAGDAGNDWVKQEDGQPLKVAAYDYGAKRNILRHLAALGAQVHVFPAETPAEKVLEYHPDGIFLSNGPGDPAGLPIEAEAVRQLIQSGVPIFGICLGHQLIGRAMNGQTRRLKFGHHGGNHPVKDLRSGRAMVTSQNHNYTVDQNTLDENEVEITHISLNDGTVEGMRLKNWPVFSVQFHPEAAPGPHDAHELFMDFYKLMIQTKGSNK